MKKVYSIGPWPHWLQQLFAQAVVVGLHGLFEASGFHHGDVPARHAAVGLHSAAVVADCLAVGVFDFLPVAVCWQCVAVCWQCVAVALLCRADGFLQSAVG